MCRRLSRQLRGIWIREGPNGTALMTVKMAVFAPMPSASVAMTTEARRRAGPHGVAEVMEQHRRLDGRNRSKRANRRHGTRGSVSPATGLAALAGSPITMNAKFARTQRIRKTA